MINKEPYSATPLGWVAFVVLSLSLHVCFLWLMTMVELKRQPVDDILTVTYTRAVEAPSEDDPVPSERPPQAPQPEIAPGEATNISDVDKPTETPPPPLSAKLPSQDDIDENTGLAPRTDTPETTSLPEVSDDSNAPPAPQAQALIQRSIEFIRKEYTTEAPTKAFFEHYLLSQVGATIELGPVELSEEAVGFYRTIYGTYKKNLFTLPNGTIVCIENHPADAMSGMPERWLAGVC